MISIRITSIFESDPVQTRLLKLNTWNEFNNYCTKRDGWAFRGQRDADWSLLCSLSRTLLRTHIAREEWQLREERAIRIFKRKAHVYLSDRSVLDDKIRCLAMMQHHGAPTRLLDFTKSPFVAAFFALERSEKDSAIFALNTPRLWRLAPRFSSELSRDTLDPRSEGNFERYFTINKHPIVWVGEPLEMDRRLVAQSGLLVMPGLLDTSLEDILEGYDSDEPLMEKVVLSHTMRSEALHALYRMNITHATLFPDIDGLARSIAYELEEVWPIDN